MSAPTPEFLRFTTHKSLTSRLVLSTLTGRPVHISRIRSSSPTAPGLAAHEISFLRLLESITNGSAIQISYTGTTLTYIPGLLTGSVSGLGASSDLIEHNIPATCTRGLSWFLLPLCILAPFAKAPLNVRFKGDGVITAATDAGDASVDTIRTALLPLLEEFGVLGAKIELRVLQRSCTGPGGKGGGGVVELRFGSQVRLPKTVHWNGRPGRVRRVRGVAYCTGVAAANNGRMIFAARGVLNGFVGDIHIAALYDQSPLAGGDEGGKKRRTGVGFGLSLVAEAGTGSTLYSADIVSPHTGGVTPEDIGKTCALQLLETIEQGGRVSRVGAQTVLTLMAMGSEDVGRLRVGRDVLGSEEIIGLGRDIRKFGGNAWGLRDINDDGSTDIIISVKGSGIGNIGRKIA